MKSPKQLRPTGKAGNKDGLKALGLTSEYGDSGEKGSLRDVVSAG